MDEICKEQEESVVVVRQASQALSQPPRNRSSLAPSNP
jgi:hypothetical protein